MLVFGPVPSRRLGNSLGVNNCFPKFCPYSCIYCQVGRTNSLSLKRRAFYQTTDIIAAVQAQLKKAVQASNPVDYITFVADGEPTLDLNLGRSIQAVQSLGLKVAVITNSSLLWQYQVREDIDKADLVSVKIDAVDQRAWRRVNRPHPDLKLEDIQEGLLAFANRYQGKLISETMLIKDINDSLKHAEALAEFLGELKPSYSYLALPIRPPAEKWAAPSGTANLNLFYQTLQPSVQNLEYLIGYEGNAFAFTGNLRDDLLSITAVHPMREDAVAQLLDNCKADDAELRKLITEGLLSEVEFEGHRYYVRKLSQAGDKTG